MNDTSREAFEKWHDETYGVKPSFNRNHEGSSHWDGGMQDRWEGWQAYEAEQSKLIAELVEALETIAAPRFQPPNLTHLSGLIEYFKAIATEAIAKAKKGEL